MVVTDWCCLFRYDSIWLNKQHVILVFSVNDSQQVTYTDSSVDTIQSSSTSTDNTGINQETRQSTEHFVISAWANKSLQAGDWGQ